MASIKLTYKGEYKKTINFLKGIQHRYWVKTLDKYVQQGLDALSSATPKDTGETAASWYAKIKEESNKITITFANSHVEKGVNIAIILQYGHGTRNGGYVVGRDYINPAIQPVFDKLAESAWKEITTS